MKKAICKLRSVSPYSQGRYHQTEKKSRELHEDYEERTWREKCNSTKEGYMFIPPMAFANSLKEAAKYRNMQIPGKGKSTYTKHFEAGIMVTEPLILPNKKDEVKGNWVHVPSDGKRGGTKRVLKCFPIINEWKGTVTFIIFDDIITEEVFEQVLRTSGELIGIGCFRPRNCGYFGRFIVEDIQWVEQ